MNIVIIISLANNLQDKNLDYCTYISHQHDCEANNIGKKKENQDNYFICN